MSATTILRDMSQAVGNGFPIFWEILPGNGEGREEGRDGGGVEIPRSRKRQGRDWDNAVDECKMSCFPPGSKLQVADQAQAIIRARGS